MNCFSWWVFPRFRFAADEIDKLLDRSEPLLFARMRILQRSAPGHAVLLAPQSQKIGMIMLQIFTHKLYPSLQNWYCPFYYDS